MATSQNNTKFLATRKMSEAETIHGSVQEWQSPYPVVNRLVDSVARKTIAGGCVRKRNLSMKGISKGLQNQSSNQDVV